MIFIVLVIVGVLGMIGTIWLSSASLRYAENPIEPGSEWFSLSPETIEQTVSAKIRQEFRKLLKVVLIWMIALYRRVSEKITIKQTVKKHVRGFLYDHTPDGIRHPSEFWHKVRKSDKPKSTTRRKNKKSQVTAPIAESPADQDVTFSQNSDNVSE
jgi:hypothetical protein